MSTQPFSGVELDRGNQISHRFDGTARADILRQIEATIAALQADFAAFHAAVFQRDRDFGDFYSHIGEDGPSANTRGREATQVALADRQIDRLYTDFATRMKMT